MKALKAGLLATFAILGVVMLVSPVRASEYDWKTKVTVTQPIEIPGQVLPAGRYVFKLLDVTGHRNIVQIWNADETRPLALIIAIPKYRTEATEKPVMQFGERPEAAPNALTAWYYSGLKGGLEFAYVGH